MSPSPVQGPPPPTPEQTQEQRREGPTNQAARFHDNTPSSSHCLSSLPPTHPGPESQGPGDHPLSSLQDHWEEAHSARGETEKTDANCRLTFGLNWVSRNWKYLENSGIPQEVLEGKEREIIPWSVARVMVGGK